MVIPNVLEKWIYICMEMYGVEVHTKTILYIYVPNDQAETCYLLIWIFNFDRSTTLVPCI
jgi:hypothetical protein